MTPSIRRAAAPVLGRSAVLACLVLAPAPSAAEPFQEYERSFGNVTLGISGGFEKWTLSGLQDALDERSATYAADGYDLYDASDFGTTYVYSAELQFRLTSGWYLRTQAEWTRMSSETRDRQSLVLLGGRELTPVSLTYTTRVQTRPLLFAAGLGRSLRFSAVRWGLSASWLVAPMRVLDEFELYMDAGTTSEVESTGIAQGAEVLLSVDYFTDSNMTLYVETFYRTGSGTVELQDADWESTILPSSRRLDLDGGGIRLGFRWI